MEYNIEWNIHPTGCAKVDQHPSLTIPAHISQTEFTTLLDMSSSVSTMHAHLVPKNRPTLRLTVVAGVHHQVHRWPVLQMTLWYGYQAHTFHFLKVDELPFPIIVGRDAPGFGALVQAAIQDMAAAEEEDTPSDGDVPKDNDPNAIQTTRVFDFHFL